MIGIGAAAPAMVVVAAAPAAARNALRLGGASDLLLSIIRRELLVSLDSTSDGLAARESRVHVNVDWLDPVIDIGK
jgi:hypothetical protein